MNHGCKICISWCCQSLLSRVCASGPGRVESKGPIWPFLYRALPVFTFASTADMLEFHLLFLQTNGDELSVPDLSMSLLYPKHLPRRRLHSFLLRRAIFCGWINPG